MRSHTLWRCLLSLLLGVCTSPILAAPGDQIFDELQTHEIRFEFGNTDWLEDLEWSWENKEYIPVAVTVNGVPYDSVGVRFKGFSSYWGYPTDKKPFRIKFNRYKDYDWDGLRKVSLNNGWSDPTLIKEKLHLDFLRRHNSNGPRGNFAKVYVNDTYWGFYSLVEHVDKTFLDDRFGNNGGNLFRANIDARLRWEGSGQEKYYDNFTLKTNEEENDWSGLIDLMSKLFHTPQPEFQDSLETVLNTSSHLLAWSVNNVTDNWDSYLEHGRNYYLYQNTDSEVFDWISWDVSLTLGGFNLPPTRSVYFAPSNHPLHFRMLQVPEYRSEYVTTVGNLVRSDFRNKYWDPRIDELAAFIEDDYLADQRRQYTTEEFSEGLLDLKSWIGNRVESIEGQISIHLMDQIVINELMYHPRSNSEAVEYIELYNALPSDQNLSGWIFDDGINFEFPPGSVIPESGYAVVTENRDSFISLYGDRPLLYEWPSGSLSNGGERVSIVDRDGLVIDEVTYDDSGNWPVSPDGEGPSLELIHPGFNNELGVSWLAANTGKATHGTPGAENSVFTTDGSAPVIQSQPETLAWVGLVYEYVVVAADADSDLLTFTLVTSPSFLKMDPVTGQMTGTPSALDLGSHTVDIEVSDGQGGSDHQIYTLVVDEPDPVFAIVINELHYNPAGADSTEFVELINTETFDVDLSGWFFSDGIEFTFPPASVLAAESFLVVAYNRPSLESAYELSGIYQWTAGRLANSGEIIEMSNATGIPVDRVSYGDALPWPESPDGMGPSLELIHPDLDNALPSSWQASATQGTPGRNNTAAPPGGGEEPGSPPLAELEEVRPNPFHHEVGIQYRLTETMAVDIGVFDVMGRRVVTLVRKEMVAGSHDVCWSGRDEDGHRLESGVYFLQLLAGESVCSRQIVLVP